MIITLMAVATHCSVMYLELELVAWGNRDGREWQRVETRIIQ